MFDYPKITLNKGREISILRKHHWIFSGAIAKKDNDLRDGDLVQVFSASDSFLGIGHYTDGSIMVRLISFEPNPIDRDFWVNRLGSALKMRKNVGLSQSPATNAYRLVHAEGDGLPGLIIDFYNGTAVIQAYHLGMHKHLEDISFALSHIYGVDLKGVYDKSADTLPKNIKGVENKLIHGKAETNLILENDCTYEIDWEAGQKTGFFMDQRENRKLLGIFSEGKTVLNTFCYSGGFSIAALKAGANEVHSVDISQKAIDETDSNVALNPGFRGKHKSITADVISYIREMEEEYDIIVLDPPAFAKNIKSKDNALKAYKKLNAEAFRKIKSGGILFTFSCSQVVDKLLFNKTVAAAAQESGRNIRILHYLSQPADHPVNIYHTETEYLKGLVLYVE